MTDPSRTPAALNKNPLNIRPLPYGEKWKGQTGVATAGASGTFCVFESNAMGVRAAVVNLRSYVRAGVRTLEQAINRWAPPGHDNNHTEAYIAYVTKGAGVDRNWLLAPIAMTNPSPEWVNNLAAVIMAMNRFEAGGQTITAQETVDGIYAALNLPAGYVRQDDGNVVRSDMKKSETLKISVQGAVTTALSTGAGAVTAMSTISDWKIAAIVAGMILVVGGVGLFFIRRLWKDRKMMNEVDIA